MTHKHLNNRTLIFFGMFSLIHLVSILPSSAVIDHEFTDKVRARASFEEDFENTNPNSPNRREKKKGRYSSAASGARALTFDVTDAPQTNGTTILQHLRNVKRSFSAYLHKSVWAAPSPIKEESSPLSPDLMQAFDAVLDQEDLTSGSSGSADETLPLSPVLFTPTKTSASSDQSSILTRRQCSEQGETIDTPWKDRSAEKIKDLRAVRTALFVEDNEVNLSNAVTSKQAIDPEDTICQFRHSLNHTVKTQEGETVPVMHINHLHQDKKELLKEIHKTHAKIIASKNTAIMTIEALVEDGAHGFKFVRYAVPHIFFSGGTTPKDDDGHILSYLVDDEYYSAVCVGDFAPEGTDRTLEEEVRGRVMSLVAECRQKTKLHYDSLKKMVRTLRAKKEDLTNKNTPLKHGAEMRLAVTTKQTCVAQHFYHSEQAFNMHLLEYKSTHLEKISANILEVCSTKNPLVHRLTTHVTSHREMCYRCAATCARVAEDAGGFVSAANEFFTKKGFRIPDEGIKAAVMGSGVVPLQQGLPKETVATHLKKEELLAAENKLLDLDVIAPQVAHMIC